MSPSSSAQPTRSVTRSCRLGLIVCALIAPSAAEAQVTEAKALFTDGQGFPTIYIAGTRESVCQDTSYEWGDDDYGSTETQNRDCFGTDFQCSGALPVGTGLSLGEALRRMENSTTGIDLQIDQADVNALCPQLTAKQRVDMLNALWAAPAPDDDIQLEPSLGFELASFALSFNINNEWIGFDADYTIDVLDCCVRHDAERYCADGTLANAEQMNLGDIACFQGEITQTFAQIEDDIWNHRGATWFFGIAAADLVANLNCYRDILNEFLERSLQTEFNRPGLFEGGDPRIRGYDRWLQCDPALGLTEDCDLVARRQETCLCGGTEPVPLCPPSTEDTVSIDVDGDGDGDSVDEDGDGLFDGVDWDGDGTLNGADLDGDPDLEFNEHFAGVAVPDWRGPCNVNYCGFPQGDVRNFHVSAWNTDGCGGDNATTMCACECWHDRYPTEAWTRKCYQYEARGDGYRPWWDGGRTPVGSCVPKDTWTGGKLKCPKCGPDSIPMPNVPWWAPLDIRPLDSGYVLPSPWPPAPDLSPRQAVLSGFVTGQDAQGQPYTLVTGGGVLDVGHGAVEGAGWIEGTLRAGNEHVTIRGRGAVAPWDQGVSLMQGGSLVVYDGHEHVSITVGSAIFQSGPAALVTFYGGALDWHAKGVAIAPGIRSGYLYTHEVQGEPRVVAGEIFGLDDAFLVMADGTLTWTLSNAGELLISGGQLELVDKLNPGSTAKLATIHGGTLTSASCQ